MHRSRFEWLWRGLALLLIAVVAIAVCARPGETKEIYCASQAGSSDAVLLDKPNPWGKIVKNLEINQPLTVIDDKTSKTHIKVKTADGIEGWIKRAASSEEKQKLTGEAGTTADSSKQGAAAKGLNSKIEADLASSDPKFRERIETINTLEITRNQKLGGGDRIVTKEDGSKEHFAVDSSKFQEAFSRFGIEGGLLRIGN